MKTFAFRVGFLCLVSAVIKVLERKSVVACCVTELEGEFVLVAIETRRRRASVRVVVRKVGSGRVSVKIGAERLYRRMGRKEVVGGLVAIKRDGGRWTET